MTFGEFADKVREIHEGNERDFGPMEVRVAVGWFEYPLHDIVFKRGKCFLCDEASAKEV